eukprot:13043296-Alexandrium_andersonii.AAC.1
MSASLVGSEMCIRDRPGSARGCKMSGPGSAVAGAPGVFDADTAVFDAEEPEEHTAVGPNLHDAGEALAAVTEALG